MTGRQQLEPSGGETHEELEARAKLVEDEIRWGCREIRKKGIFLAGRLCEFTENRMWEPLGYETQEEWLAGPEIELKRTQVMRLVRVYRTLVLERDVPLVELEVADPSKLDVVLPAIKAGKVAWQDAVMDARNLGRGDLEKRYRLGGDELDDRLDAEREAAKVRCPTCSQWASPQKLDDHRASVIDSMTLAEVEEALAAKADAKRGQS